VLFRSEVLETYSRRFPLVELSLFDRRHAEIIELVKNGEADFGITVESLVPVNFGMMRWKQVDSVLLAPHGHPLAQSEGVTVEEIAQYSLILPPKSKAYSSRNRLEKLFREHGLQVRVVMESSNVELSSLYVEMGLGLTYASIERDCLRKLSGRKLEFIPLGHYFQPEQIVVIFRKDRELTAYKKAFLGLLSADSQ
jgi:DNA-binding transcriptional LysR family regulator